MSSEVAFEVAKDEFTSAVNWVARSLPSRPTMPVLRAMMIEAKEDGLEISGYDFEVSTMAHVAAHVSTPGQVAVAGKLLAGICSALPGDHILLSVEDKMLVITAGKSRFELPLIETSEYPQLPSIPAVSGEINSNAFIHAVNQVANAATKDDNLPMLTGINMLIDGKKITLAATDRFRLALRKIEWNPRHPEVKGNLLIPASKLGGFVHIAESGLDENLTINAGDGQELESVGLFGITANSRKTTTKMLDANFPKTETLLPSSYTTVVEVNIAELNAALRRVGLVAAGQPIRLDFTAGELRVSANGPDAGRSQETMGCNLVGQEISTAFNLSYLKDGLSTMDSDSVLLGFTDPTRPAVMVPSTGVLPTADDKGHFPAFDTDFIYLLMPVRLSR